MNQLLRLAAVIEGITGLVLMADAPLFLKLLLGDGTDERAAAIGRLAGIALMALALACWPASGAADSAAAPVRAMFIYNLAVTVYLGLLRFSGQATGRLLWLAVVVHAVFTILFVRSWINAPLARQTKG